MSLERFHPLIADWFRGRFGRPTEVQARGWEAIATGRHALLCAPTGSGKTLAAFLTCIDSLVRAALEGRLEERAAVVYVSPLKALSNDVHRNLEEPLAEIAALAAERGIALPEIRIATRTGDTPASERQRTAKRPPHVWITTPESLYILLTSESGRRGLAGARTLILDEIHAVADDKRGSHLALSVERLEALAGASTEGSGGAPLQRIGLSATVRPIEEVARLLVGTANVAATSAGTAGAATAAPGCAIVDEGHRRVLEIALEVPRDELGPIATLDLWDEVLDRVAALAKENRTTLVFVNTRRLVERVAHQLSARLGEESVAAHHGSLSRKTRLLAEARLKRGEVRVCVATASLELGIDIGSIDLVCQIGSPRSVSVALQRIGRSGHGLGRTPRGLLFPLTRDDLVECTALLRLIARGEIDRLGVPSWPLDVLAQQIVAACAAEAWEEDRLFDLVRRAWPYRDLPRDRFDQVVKMLSEGYATSGGRRSAWLHRDGVGRTLRGRRGARLAALTSGGAIPDTADYDVVLEPEGTLVGRVNEDFAIESMAGDVFLLGNASWRIRRIERARVRVEDARGSTPTVPFWLGEAPARTDELSAAVGDLRDEVDRRLGRPEGAGGAMGEAAAFLMREIGEAALPPSAAAQIVAYVVEGKRVLGVVPTARRVVAERFFDESGGMQLVIHAPFGGRVNRAWGLALRKRFCRAFDFELQAAGTDDGISLALGPQHSFPLADVAKFLRAAGVEEVLTQAVLPSPLFTTRWRWTASRALALLRHQGGRRVPAPLQRMRAEDLLAAVFPAQAACQDNAPGGDVALPGHPLVFETMRDCLHEALDLEGLRAVLGRIEAEEIEFVARDTTQPSVFAHQILNAMPYAFLDDAPLEERRARAVALRRALPEDARELGRLDPEAIRAAADDAWPAPRDADELHDALLGLLILPAGLVEKRFGATAEGWVSDLAAAGRVTRAGGHWVAAERAELAAQALAGRGDAVAAVVRGWAEVTGPFRCADLARTLSLPADRLEEAAAVLEGEGMLLRGSFTGGAAGASGIEWCDRRILARIHRATIAALRREIEPVSAADFLRFLWGWQHVNPASRLDGPDGLLAVVGMLQGFEAAAGAWEEEILPARLGGYDPADLDHLCLGGQVVWGRFSRRSLPEDAGPRRGPVTRATTVTLALREDLEWLLPREPGERALSSRARQVLDFLKERGASFTPDIARGCRLLPSELDEALGELVASGKATADGFGPLRRVAGPASARRRSARSRSRFVRRLDRQAAGEGRWSVLDRPEPEPADAPEARVAQYLRRYGVVFRDLMAREAGAPAWRDLLAVLRRAEARGEVRGGRFVAGFVGEQFALAEAVEAIRRTRRQDPPGSLLAVSACDPLNLAGILTPGPRVAATPGNRLVLRDGVPVAWCEAGGDVTARADLDGDTAARARSLLQTARSKGAPADPLPLRAPAGPASPLAIS
jgi:ATP-dependent Lhr-like helicase